MAAGLIAAGCGGADRTDDFAEVAEWMLTEELRIGSVDDPELGFSKIGDVALDSAGVLYVLDTQERQVRVFDESGRLIRRIGRRGDGPGELEDPFDFGIVGDTLWISEMGGNRRLTLFSTTGSLITTINALPKTFSGSTGRVLVTLVPGSLESGGILPSKWVATSYGFDTVIVPRVRFDLQGQVIDTVGWDTVGAERSRRGLLRIAGVNGPHPGRPILFDDDPIAAARGRVRVERRLATSYDSASFTVMRMDTTGDTLWTRVYRYRPVSAAPEQISQAAADAGDIYRFRGVDSLVVDRAIREALEIPPFLPTVTEARLVGDEVWLRREATFNRLVRWTVLDRNGDVAGQVRVPSAATPRIFRNDRIWAVYRDELDVPWIVRYRIARG